MNPMMPTKISVMKNPSSVKTNTSSFVMAKSVVNSRMLVSSRVPRPAKVMGRNPAAFAMGKSMMKAR